MMFKPGIHHVTAIAGAPKRNLDFYVGVLGMRFVKKTVNFDDPGTYHFYYGDETGQPGTILTFFPWDHAAPGRVGVGETEETAFRIPEASVGYWMHRLIMHGAPAKREVRFGESVLTLRDPDRMRIALVAVPGIEAEPGWSDGTVPAEHAIRGVHTASLLVADKTKTAAILTDVLGFTEVGSEGAVTRYRAGDTAIGGLIDLHEAGEFFKGRPGAGSVHHIAFRADEEGQAAMVQRLAEAHGIRTTPQVDRDYFRSVYFREPGGVLFEIATEDPGFTVDEPLDVLGQALKLPKNYEPHRAEIEARLPVLA